MLKINSLILLIFWCALVSAEEVHIIDINDIPEVKLTKLLNNITSMHAHFSQTVSNKSGTILQEQTGIMQLKKPNLLHWQVLMPDRLLIVTNGYKIWYYDMDLEQVIVKKFSSEISSAKISSLLLGDLNKVMSNFEVSNLESENDCHSAICFELNSNMANNQEECSFVKAQLGFNQQNQLVTLKLYDQLEQETEFTFSKIKNKVKSGVFKFTIPPGVDVIQE